MIWNRIKKNVPDIYIEEAQKKIHDGEDMFLIIEWVKRLNMEDSK